MIQNYIKTALRQLMRNKGFSLINILGLAVGIACCLIIVVYVRDEISFDNFHQNGDHVYRIALDRKYPEHNRHYAIIPHSYARAIKDEFPEVEEVTRFFHFQGNTFDILKGDELYEEDLAYFADSTFFKIFDIPLIQGEADKALAEPNTVVLTESIAKKYFNRTDVVGEILRVQGFDNDMVVSGVCEDVPENSHLTFELLMSTSGNALGFIQQDNYINFSAFTYLLLKEGTNAALLESKLPEVVRKYASGQVQRQFNVTYDEYVAAGNGYHYFLQSLPSIYLNSNLENELRPPGSKTRVYIFSVIAFFILLIAIINFMNLATARSTERAKEVGIRKTLGSVRGQLISQFMTEAILVSVLSMVIAFAILNLLLPVFNQLSGKEFAFSEVLNLKSIPLFMLFALFIGALAGSYPSLVLSSFRPIEVLKGKLVSTTHGRWLRNGLVVFQFMISVILIISTIVVYRQMEFIRNKELGFNQQQLVSIQGAFQLQAQSQAFKDELLRLPEVRSVGACNALPGGYFFGVSFQKEGDNETTFGSGMVIDENFIECMQMEILDGRDFDRSYNDSLSIMLNETAVKQLGLTAPVGKRLVTNDNPGGGAGDEFRNYTVVGVVKDFHFQSLHQTISPMFFYLNPNQHNASNLISLRVEPDNIQQTIQRIEGIWGQFLPNQPFKFTFLDADLTALYQAELVAQKVFGLFSILAIFIACLGLLGLAAYVTQQRTKEIGIRKVLGASVTNIVGLLSKDFLKLVGIALLVAAPVAWYAMRRWLSDFAYRIDLSWWMFALAGALAILIAFLTVSYQSIRAAVANPINSLKDE
jgi:putative ABC transport system permease protein